jgi:hypothetical protein
MPVLPNARHEKFAQELAQGKTATESYVLAGYRPSGKNAGRLKKKDEVSARVLELQGAAANRAEITLEGILRELDEAIAIAKKRGMPNALINAASLRSRLGGLLVERQEIAVVNTEDEPECAQEVLHRVAGRVSVEAAVTLGRCFGVEFDPTWSPDSEPIRAPGYSQRMIEEQKPIVNGRKRQVG